MSFDLAYRNITLTEDASACLLCNRAPCSRACPYGLAPDEVIRSVRFENDYGAANKLPENVPCASCKTKDCLAACVKGRLGRPVPVDEVMMKASTFGRTAAEPVDLSIDFCGVRCENPFFLSSSVVANNYEMVAKAFELGWAGVVFKTIGTFVPNEVSPRFGTLSKESTPFVGFENIEQISEHTLKENMQVLSRLKRDYPSKIIVASIMGQTEREWTELASLMTDAGVDIIECNFSCPHMAGNGLGSDVGQNPELVAAYTKAVRAGTYLPVLAKMTPNIVHMEIPAIAAMEAGATGIAAINTIKSIVRVDLDSFSASPDVSGKTSAGGYSGKAVKPIALRFIQTMASCERLAGVPLSGMGGIETWRDAAEFIALGCTNIQVTTAVMQYGYRIIEDLLEGMRLYLAKKGCSGLSGLVGKALPSVVPAEELDRSSICFPKFDRSQCVGCGRCYLSCYDGGHQAIKQDEATAKPILDAKKCVGCHLCLAVCPVGAISPGGRVPKKRS